MVKHYDEPATDDQRLFNLQYDYKSGNAGALATMYELLAEIAFKTINSRSAKNSHIQAMSADARKQRAHDAATYIIEQYLKRPEFEITDSITGYLYRRIQWELYGKEHQRKCDQMLVFTDELPDRNGSGKRHRYIVSDIHTGESTSYGSADELYTNPAFRGLRKKRLVESIQTGKRWKHYTFDILEVDG